MTELPQTPTFRLDGKRALVTGAGRGLGAACAAALADAGAHVTLWARSEIEIASVAQQLRDRGGTADHQVIDVMDERQVVDAVAAAAAYDILINNAGTNRPKPFADVTPDDFDAVMTLNVRAAFFVAQAVARRMIETATAGSIIHMSSQMGHVGGANRTIYCASKWALEGLNKAMAIDLAPHRIRSNTIAPTFVETPLTAPFFTDTTFRNDVLRRIKLGRMGRLEDIMGAVVFLASEAASLITGTSLVVDGGWTAD